MLAGSSDESISDSGDVVVGDAVRCLGVPAALVVPLPPGRTSQGAGVLKRLGFWSALSEEGAVAPADRAAGAERDIGEGARGGARRCEHVEKSLGDGVMALAGGCHLAAAVRPRHWNACRNSISTGYEKGR